MSNIVPLEVVTVHAPVAGGDANDFPGPFTALRTPQQLEAAFDAGWSGGNVLVTGTDPDNRVITELFAETANSVVQGTKVFKSVTAAAKATMGLVPGNVTLRTSYPTIGPKQLVEGGLPGCYESSVTALMLKAVMTSGAVDLLPLFWEDGKWWPHPGGALAVDAATALAKRAVSRYVTPPRKTYYHLWKTGSGTLDKAFLDGFTLNWPA